MLTCKLLIMEGEQAERWLRSKTGRLILCRSASASLFSYISVLRGGKFSHITVSKSANHLCDCLPEGHGMLAGRSAHRHASAHTTKRVWKIVAHSVYHTRKLPCKIKMIKLDHDCLSIVLWRLTQKIRTSAYCREEQRRFLRNLFLHTIQELLRTFVLSNDSGTYSSLLSTNSCKLSYPPKSESSSISRP